MLSERPRTAGELHQAFPIAGPAVSRHLRVLREAGLIAEGPAPGDRRVRLYTLRIEPFGELAQWLAELQSHWNRQLRSFQDYVASQGEADVAGGRAGGREPLT